MPELPEVEVTRLSFASRIEGARIQHVWMGKPLRWPLQTDPDSLVGRQVLGVRRRGKYLLLDVDNGVLLIHLGMSGRLTFAALTASTRDKHDHFECITSHGVLRLRDPRRFGAVVFVNNENEAVAQKLLGKLGVEPLTDAFNPRLFFTQLHMRKTAIKQVLLAGDLVVGVGNIYASEALFKAGIRPTVAACQISKARVERLHAAIVEVLTQALDLGGSTLRDFSNAHGEDGHFQLQAMVYGREGLPCKVCGAPIQMIRQGQRSSFYCNKCQKR
jgi:formamidopyrimidine-DNA glycosylase